MAQPYDPAFVTAFGGDVGVVRSTTPPPPPNVPSDNTSDAASTTTATLTWNGVTGLVILAVFPANANRLQADIVNTTGSEIVLAIDDGAGNNLSMLPIDPGVPYAQGGRGSRHRRKGPHPRFWCRRHLPLRARELTMRPPAPAAIARSGTVNVPIQGA